MITPAPVKHEACEKQLQEKLYSLKISIQEPLLIFPASSSNLECLKNIGALNDDIKMIKMLNTTEQLFFIIYIPKQSTIEPSYSAATIEPGCCSAKAMYNALNSKLKESKKLVSFLIKDSTEEHLKIWEINSIKLGVDNEKLKAKILQHIDRCEKCKELVLKEEVITEDL